MGEYNQVKIQKIITDRQDILHNNNERPNALFLNLLQHCLQFANMRIAKVF